MSLQGDLVRFATHGALLAAMGPQAASFARATRHTQRAQAETLKRLQRSWRGTALATQYPQLLTISDPRELRNVAPLSTWESMADDAAAAADGAPYARSRSRIVRFERSGGSSGAQKLVPLTEAFLADVQRGLAPWLFDLYAQHPGLRTGSAYWSISPIGDKAAPTKGGHAVGSDDDSSYLPAPLAGLLQQVLVASPALAAFPDIDSCRYATLRLLLARDDLALISVWSPTFLTLLLSLLDEHHERLIDDIADGTCRGPRLVGDVVTEREARVAAAVAQLPLTADPQRADRLRRHVAAVGTLRPVDAWPRLQLVSLWQDAESRRYVGDVATRLPGVPLQGKGLLATEGIITIPLSSAPAPVLCVQSHVFEFLVDAGSERERVLLPHELVVGDVAEVVLTTSSGLLRYRLGDRVEVVGHHGDAPCLRLLGRAGVVGDLVGEKLAADRVATVLHEAGMVAGVPRFAMLVPLREGQPRYRLYLDGLAAADAAVFAAAVDAGLSAGHPWRYARQLGQLLPIEPILVDDAMRRYEAQCVQRGQRAGDIKALALSLDDRWHDVFMRNTDRDDDDDDDNDSGGERRGDSGAAEVSAW